MAKATTPTRRRRTRPTRTGTKQTMAQLCHHTTSPPRRPHTKERRTSAQGFPFPWGERYFVARIEWKSDGTRGAKIASTAGEPLTQEEEDLVVEFLDTLQEGTALKEIAQRARDTHPNRLERFFQMRRMWPWRSKCNTFMWLGTLLGKLQQARGAHRPYQQAPT